MPDIGTYNININANVKNFADGIKKAESGLTQLQASVQRLERTLTAFVGLYIFRQLAQGVGEAVKQVTNLEDAMVGVGRTTGLSGGSLKELQNTFIELSTSIPKTAVELSQMGFVAGQLGITGVADIEKFVSTIAKVTMVTKMSADQAATSYAKTAAALRMPISDVGKLASAMLYLETASSASTEEILSASQKMAGMAFNAGISAAGVLALSTALIESGVQAGKAGTLMGTVFQKMLERYREVANQMGVKAEDWKRSVETDMLGSLMTYLSFLNSVPSSVDKVGLSFQIFGQLGDRVTLSLIDKISRLKDLYKQAGEEIKSETLLNEQAAQMTATLSSQWQLLNSEVSKFVLESNLLPFLKESVSWLTSFVKNIGDASSALKKGGIDGSEQFTSDLMDRVDAQMGWSTEKPGEIPPMKPLQEESFLSPVDSMFGTEEDIALRTEYTKGVLSDMDSFQWDLSNGRWERSVAEFESMKTLHQTLMSFQKTGWQGFFDFVNMGIKTFSSAMTTALTGIITGTMKAGEAFKQFGKSMIAAIVEFFVQWAIQALIGMALSKTMNAWTIAQAGLLETAWAGAAFFAAVATQGGAVVAGSAALGAGYAAARGMTIAGQALGGGKGTALGGGLPGGETMSFGGSPVTMAQGGLITEPTMTVGMRSGQLGLMGEAGPESVVPMNDRGSSSSSNNAIQVAININTPFSADDRIFWDNVAREYIVPAIERNSGREVA